MMLVIKAQVAMCITVAGSSVKIAPGSSRTKLLLLFVARPLTVVGGPFLTVIVIVIELHWKALCATPGPKQPRNEELAALQRSPGELLSELLNGLRKDNGVTRSQGPRPNGFVQLQLGSGRNSKTPQQIKNRKR